MPSIDMHNHIIPADVVSFLEREGQSYSARIVEREGRRFVEIQESALRPLSEKMVNPEARIRDMDADSLDMQAISCSPPLMFPEVNGKLGLALSQCYNDAIASIASSDRFVGMGMVPIQDAKASISELERLVKLGFRSVQIPTNVGSRTLDEPEFEDFWSAAEALDLLVYLHPFEAARSGGLNKYGLGGIVGNLYDTGLAATLLIFGGVLERHPKLSVVLSHGGGTLPSLIGRMDMGYKSFPGAGDSIPRPPSTYFNQLYFDTITFNPNMLRYLIDTYGSDRVVLGSDYPMAMAQPATDVRNLGLDARTEQAVLGDNAFRLLGHSAKAV